MRNKVMITMEAAAIYIGTFLTRWGRIPVSLSEYKFHSVRVNCCLTNFYQRFIYRLAYKRAVKKYPLIRKEILTNTGYPKLIRS